MHWILRLLPRPGRGPLMLFPVVVRRGGVDSVRTVGARWTHG